MLLDTLALLVDTYWVFLVGALIIGILIGWIAADADTNPNSVKD